MSDDTDRVTMFDRIRKWADDSGFDLELDVAQAFLAAGFQVQQSAYYVDPESGDAREIDLVAEDPTLDNYFGALQVMFVVECKASRKGPWVMFASRRSMTLGNRFMNFAVLSGGASDAVSENFDELVARVQWFTKDDGRVAYAFRQAFARDGSDPAFNASVSVTKACAAALSRAITEPPSAVVVFPVIVVDAPLVVCTLGADGAVALEEVDEFEYAFHGMRDPTVSPCIRVITRSRVPGFAEDARKSAGDIRDALAGWIEDYKQGVRSGDTSD